MPQSASALAELFDGLQALSNAAFPKHCAGCGQQYDSLDQLIAETTSQQGSGLKPAGTLTQPAVAVERQCRCGAVISESFGDRRDSGAVAAQRRVLFERLLGLLTEGGMPQKMAKKELLKVMKGQPSELLNQDQLTRFFTG